MDFIFGKMSLFFLVLCLVDHKQGENYLLLWHFLIYQFWILCTNNQLILVDPWNLSSAMLYFVSFLLLQQFYFGFVPIFDTHIFGEYQKGHLKIFERRQFALFSFSLRFSRWCLNVRCSSSISPIYFV